MTSLSRPDSLNTIDLRQKLSLFDDHWHPRLVAELNGQHVKVAKVLGAFDWHRHAAEDELFLVVEGELRIEYRDETGREAAVTLAPGQMLVVPAGVEHRPVAERECSIVLFEPAGTLNTGDVRTRRTVEHPERI